MKKFFVAVCVCGLAAFNVSAQEPVAETTVIAPAVQEAVAPVAETPVVETPAPAQTDSVVEGGVVDQTYSAATVYAAAPSDCGCEAVDPCAPAVDPCCETARPRLFSRLRAHFSRSNDDCCCY